jgi:CBS domain-containing protein
MTLEISRGPADAVFSTPVGEAMASPVVTVDESTEMPDVLRLFVAGGISAAPVVDRSGRPIGVLSKTDLLREQYDNPASFHQSLPDGPALDAGDAPPSLPACCARDIMTAGVVLIERAATIGQAAALMMRENVHRVFVVDGQGALVGVLAAIDIVRWLARGAEQAE